MGLKEVEDILRDVDLNGDGLVDFEGKLFIIVIYLKEQFTQKCKFSHYRLPKHFCTLSQQNSAETFCNQNKFSKTLQNYLFALPVSSEPVNVQTTVTGSL